MNASETGHRAPQEVVLEARGLRKTYGHVTALDGADFHLRAGEVLAVVGDNGAGKSTLIKALVGALTPDEGSVVLDGHEVHFKGPQDARALGIEVVYQDLAVVPGLDIASNVFLGREVRKPGIAGSVFRRLDKRFMLRQASDYMRDLQIGLRDVTVAVENLSGGQRQGVAVARAAAFAKRIVFMDEPTAALGVRESGMVLDLIRRVRDRGLAVVLISHNMQHVFDIADRIHIHRLGRRVGVIDPQERTASEVVAIMTGATAASPEERAGGRWQAPTGPGRSK
ncbi:sugar ABC transporter ATP-binding protein [Micrococcales bacterium 31B]|nr:sugar ABC transporter ATP-binding protein [Micrococcales bacterium 31B]